MHWTLCSVRKRPLSDRVRHRPAEQSGHAELPPHTSRRAPACNTGYNPRACNCEAPLLRRAAKQSLHVRSGQKFARPGCPRARLSPRGVKQGRLPLEPHQRPRQRAPRPLQAASSQHRSHLGKQNQWPSLWLYYFAAPGATGAMPGNSFKYSGDSVFLSFASGKSVG